MRLATIDYNSQTRAAVLADSSWVPLDAPDIAQLIAAESWREHVEGTLARNATERIDEANVRFLRPILRPAKIVNTGLNYRDHIIETGRDTPEFPTLFAKFADTLTDPYAEINIQGSSKVDWEAELTVVIGSHVSRATREEAQRAILGYTVANDVSARDWQARTLQWFQGKAWDRTTPLGPVITTADEIDPSAGLEIGARIGDETVQQSNTRELVFDCADLVSYVSHFTALSAGDLILTGTPGGVGLGRTPQRFLADGEVLTTWIEGIGELRNTFRITPTTQNTSESETSQ